MKSVEIVSGEEVLGIVSVPDSYSGNFWSRKAIFAPCNYVRKEGNKLFVIGYTAGSEECEHCEECRDFRGFPLELPEGSIVEIF